MHYTLIDKNEFIPKIITGDSNLLKDLNKYTINKDINYCKNIYVIQYGDFENIMYVYFSDGTKLYNVDDEGISEYTQIKQCSKEKVFENIRNFFENIKNNKNSSYDMDIEISPLLENEGNYNNVEYSDNVETIKETVELVPDIKNDALEECELMYEMYLKEKERKKKIEEDLKIEEKNERELYKKKRHMEQEKIITLKGNYRTYLNIKKDILKNTNMSVPETFETQYEYFENMEEENLKLIEELDDLEIMNSETYNENILSLAVIFCEKIGELKEKLTFTHNWSELDNEYKVGSYSVGYN